MSSHKRRTITYIVTVCELDRDVTRDVDRPELNPFCSEELEEHWPLPSGQRFPSDMPRC